METYNKRAKELGRPLTVLDTKITAALLKESSVIIAGLTATSASSGYTGIRVKPSGKFEAKIYVDGTTEVLGSE